MQEAQGWQEAWGEARDAAIMQAIERVVILRKPGDNAPYDLAWGEYSGACQSIDALYDELWDAGINAPLDKALYWGGE